MHEPSLLPSLLLRDFTIVSTGAFSFTSLCFPSAVSYVPTHRKEENLVLSWMMLRAEIKEINQKFPMPCTREQVPRRWCFVSPCTHFFFFTPPPNLSSPFSLTYLRFVNSTCTCTLASSLRQVEHVQRATRVSFGLFVMNTPQQQTLQLLQAAADWE